MAFVKPADRTIESSLTSGNGPYSLAGAVDNSCFAFGHWMADGDTTVGVIVEPGVAFWAGTLQYTLSTNQIATSGSPLVSLGTFGGGTKEIFMGLPSAKQISTFDIAAVSDLLAATAGKLLDAATIWSAGAELALSDGSSATVTFTNGSANISWAAAPAVNAPVHFTTTGGLPTNFAIATEYYIKTNSGGVVTVAATRGGSAIVAGSAGSGTQTGVARVLVDGSLGINFVLNTIGGNRTFAKPYNFKAGQSGRVRIVQDGTGSRSATFNSADGWKKEGANAIVLTTTPAADDLVYYDAVSSSDVRLGSRLDWR